MCAPRTHDEDRRRAALPPGRGAVELGAELLHERRLGAPAWRSTRTDV
jgi:hypothetical protein